MLPKEEDRRRRVVPTRRFVKLAARREGRQRQYHFCPDSEAGQVALNRDSRGALLRIRAMAKRLRRTYFPRWDPGRAWKFDLWEDSRQFHALCDCRKKRIFIADLPGESNAYLASLVIHEICHATTNLGHGIPWANRMRRAADRARRIGELELSALLIDDVDLESSNLEWMWDSAFGPRLSELAAKHPNLSFAAALDKILVGRWRMGWNCRTFDSCYPQARKLFAAAKLAGRRTRPS